MKSRFNLVVSMEDRLLWLTGEWEDSDKRNVNLDEKDVNLDEKDVNLDAKDVNLGNSLKTFGCKEVMRHRVIAGLGPYLI